MLKTIQVDYNYTEDEQAQGLAKLVEAATVYDATGPACLGLGAFQVLLQDICNRPQLVCVGGCFVASKSGYKFGRKTFNINQVPGNIYFSHFGVTSFWALSGKKKWHSFLS